MTVDRFGRVVIPQSVREQFHLRQGTRLTISQERGDALVLKMVQEAPPLKRMYGVLVIAAKGTPLDVDMVDLIKHDREERIQKIIAWDKPGS